MITTERTNAAPINASEAGHIQLVHSSTLPVNKMANVVKWVVFPPCSSRPSPVETAPASSSSHWRGFECGSDVDPRHAELWCWLVNLWTQRLDDGAFSRLKSSKGNTLWKVFLAQPDSRGVSAAILGLDIDISAPGGNVPAAMVTLPRRRDLWVSETSVDPKLESTPSFDQRRLGKSQRCNFQYRMSVHLSATNRMGSEGFWRGGPALRMFPWLRLGWFQNWNLFCWIVPSTVTLEPN